MHVISTEAADSPTVRCAMERCLHFAVAVVLALVCSCCHPERSEGPRYLPRAIPLAPVNSKSAIFPWSLIP